MRRTYTFVEPVGDAVINVLVAIIVGDLYWRGERIPLKIEIIIVHKRLHHIKHITNTGECTDHVIEGTQCADGPVHES